MNAVDVGKFIALQRKNLSLTQKELAVRLNVTDKAVSKWETGKCYPDIEIIEKLSVIFDVGINEILSGKIIEPDEQVAEAEQNVISVMKYSQKKLNCWKYVALILSLFVIIITVFSGININNDIKDHQFLQTTEAIFDSKNSMRIDIPEIGLKSVLIRQLEDNIKLEGDDFGTVYLLADNRYDVNSVVADCYLVVSMRGKIFAKDLSVWDDHRSLGTTLYCADIDGDDDKEIILQECVGLSGGAGQYLSRVFDFRNNEIVEIFSSKYKDEKFNTGFSGTILKNWCMKIENKYTGYCQKFDLSDRKDEYYGFWYDSNGEPQKWELMVDTFYKFEPCDIDNDGIYEIKICQYTSLIGHADFIGTAISFLKYNESNDSFEVCDAFFEVGKIA